MFTPQELKIVIDTLNTRKAWLVKSASENNDEEASQNQQSSAKLLDTAITKINSIGASSTSEESSEKSSEVDFSKLRILIADDSEDSAYLTKELLGDMGAKEIDSAEDGVQALKKIFQAKKPYHLVICDWNMPGKNGTEVHEALKTDRRFKNLVFIMISAESGSEEIKTAIQQGIDDFIVKPLDSDILKNKIIRAIRQRSS